MPIITTDCGGGAEVVSGLGQLFTLGDHEALATKFIQASQATETIESTAIAERFNQLFSDEAATQHFWQLQKIRTLLTK